MKDYYVHCLKREIILKGYSRNTQNSYAHCLMRYLKYRGDSVDLDIDSIKNFIVYLREKGLSSSSTNLYLQAIKFFYRYVMHVKGEIPISIAVRNKKLPTILSREEIQSIIKVTKNPKHSALLSLAYGAGLRVSEVIRLKVHDFDLTNLRIHIRQSKGNKDRLTIFPQKWVSSFIHLSEGLNSGDYIFPSSRGGCLHPRSAQNIFKNSLKKALIPKSASFHSLRHSFATHLIENGYSTRHIQVLLGHNNIRTTERYTHINKSDFPSIKSPL